MNSKLSFVLQQKQRLRAYWYTSKQLSSEYRLEVTRFADWLRLHVKIYYVKLKRLFISAKMPDAAEGRLNLHLGCGKIDHNKFINIDGYPFPHVHYVQTIDKLPQFKDGSVDLIYASHCLEHFGRLQTGAVLSEWYRVLKKGAILRISVPDFDKLVELYSIYNRDPDVILPQLMGGQNNKYNFHLTAFNKVNLSRLLLGAGFSEIREWQPGADDLSTFNDFSVYKKEVLGTRYEISLNIEAVK